MTSTASPTTPTPPSTNGTEQSLPSTDALSQLIEQITGKAMTDVAFGTPRVVGARTLLPVARVTYQFDAGSTTNQELKVRPLAVIEIRQDKVRVLPIIDFQTLMARVFAFGTAAMLFAAFLTRPRATEAGTHVKIGQIAPHLSVTSTPKIHLQRPRGRWAA